MANEGNFFGAISQQSPIFGSVVPQQQSMSLPGLSPLANMGLQTALAPMMQQTNQRYGLFPAMFASPQNLYDQQQAAAYYREQQRALAAAAQRDARIPEQAIHGVARMLGEPITSDAGRAQVRTMAEDFSRTLLPTLSTLFPEIVDQMGGRPGSETVLTQAIHRAGLHGIDPVTGRIGLSGSSSSALADEIFQTRFGAGANILATRGLRAGQLGMLQESLQNRGMLAPTIGTKSRTEQVLALADADFDDAALGRIATRQGISIDEVRADRQELQQEAKRIRGGGRIDHAKIDQMASFDEGLRTLDAQHIGGGVEKFSGAVAAMRDLFGDNGKTGSIPELLAAVDNMTQQGLTSMSPQRIEKMVRDTHQLAKQSGVSLEAIMGLTTQAAARADQLGINRGFANPAVQGAVAFGRAAGDTQRLDIARFGSLSQEELTMQDMNLRLQAAESPLANQLGAFARLADQGLLDAGSESAAIAAAVKAGKTTYTFNGKDKSVFQAEGVHTGILGRDLGSTQIAEQNIRATAANEEFKLQYNIPNLVRENAQTADVIPLASQGFQAAIRGLNLADVSPEVGAAISDEVTAAYYAVPIEQIRDPIAQQQFLQDQIKAAAAKRGVSMTEAQAKQAASTGAALSDQIFHNTPGLEGSRSLFGSKQLQNQQTLQRGRDRRAEAGTAADISAALSGLGVSPGLQRVMDTIMGADANDDFVGAAAKLLTGIPAEDVKRLHPVLQELHTHQQAFSKAERYTGERDESEQLVAESMGLSLAEAKAAPDFQARVDRMQADVKPRIGSLTARGVAQQKDAAENMQAILQGGNLAQGQLLKMQQQLGVRKDDVDTDAIRTAIAQQPADQRAALTQRLQALEEAKAGRTTALLEAAGEGVQPKPGEVPDKPGVAAAGGKVKPGDAQPADKPGEAKPGVVVKEPAPAKGERGPQQIVGELRILGLDAAMLNAAIRRNGVEGGVVPPGKQT